VKYWDVRYRDLVFRRPGPVNVIGTWRHHSAVYRVNILVVPAEIIEGIFSKICVSPHKFGSSEIPRRARFANVLLHVRGKSRAFAAICMYLCARACHRIASRCRQADPHFVCAGRVYVTLTMTLPSSTDLLRYGPMMVKKASF
jgi:hypothetical protein